MQTGLTPAAPPLTLSRVNFPLGVIFASGDAAHQKTYELKKLMQGKRATITSVAFVYGLSSHSSFSEFHLPRCDDTQARFQNHVAWYDVS
jgi:hypothetical protein